MNHYSITTTITIVTSITIRTTTFALGGVPWSGPTPPRPGGRVRVREPGEPGPPATALSLDSRYPRRCQSDSAISKQCKRYPNAPMPPCPQAQDPGIECPHVPDPDIETQNHSIKQQFSRTRKENNSEQTASNTAVPAYDMRSRAGSPSVHRMKRQACPIWSYLYLHTYQCATSLTTQNGLNNTTPSLSWKPQQCPQAMPATLPYPVAEPIPQARRDADTCTSLLSVTKVRQNHDQRVAVTIDGSRHHAAFVDGHQGTRVT